MRHERHEPLSNGNCLFLPAESCKRVSAHSELNTAVVRILTTSEAVW